MTDSDLKRPELKNYGSYLANNEAVAADVRLKLELLWNLRSAMRDRGYVEAPMPVLHATREGAPVHQFTTENPVTGSRYYLRHCMEDHLKRLVPVIPRLFELGKAIRVEVEDLARAEEFLVLEAVAGDVTFEQGCQLVLDVLHDALQRTFGDVRFEAFDLGSARSVAFDDLAAEALGVDPGLADGALVKESRRWLVANAPQEPSEDATDWALMEDFMKYAVEPLCTVPTMLKGFPPALRHISPIDPTTGRAERFALVSSGIEFCDGGMKFSSVDEYREVYETNARLREVLLGVTDNDLPEDFFADLGASPRSVFTFGLGVDRLFALIKGCSIHDIIQFPHH